MASDNETTLAQLKQVIADFVAEREWQKFHDPKNLSMAIAIEAAELMEHFQWLRNEELAAEVSTEQLDEIRDELADVMAFVLSLANVLEIDIAAAVEGKMVKNRKKYPPETFKGRFR